MKLLAFFLFLSTIAFAKDHAWQDGKLINVAKEGDGTALGTTSGSLAVAFAQSHAIFVVQVGDIIYSVRGERVNRNGNFDPTTRAALIQWKKSINITV